MEFQNDTTKIPQTPVAGIPPTETKENFFKEILKFTILAVIIVVPVRMFIAQPFIVSGASMDPTFTSGQYLIVDQLSYHFDEPKRNDVVIFKYPINPKTYFIKRIIGLPGETLKATNGQITITSTENPDGQKLEEPYIAANHKTADNFSITLGPSEYFVMGDNRTESSDSRLWGPLERKYIIGRPALRLFPFSQIAVSPGK